MTRSVRPKAAQRQAESQQGLSSSPSELLGYSTRHEPWGLPWATLSSAMGEGTARVPVRKPSGNVELSRAQLDALAVEEPLEVRLAWGEGGSMTERSVAVTLRTPRNDRELAVGFLCTEGIVVRHDQVVGWTITGNVVRVELAPDLRVDLRGMERNFYVGSSCGVCGSFHRRGPRAADLRSFPARATLGAQRHPGHARSAAPRAGGLRGDRRPSCRGVVRRRGPHRHVA